MAAGKRDKRAGDDKPHVPDPAPASWPEFIWIILGGTVKAMMHSRVGRMALVVILMMGALVYFAPQRIKDVVVEALLTDFDKIFNRPVDVVVVGSEGQSLLPPKLYDLKIKMRQLLEDKGHKVRVVEYGSKPGRARNEIHLTVTRQEQGFGLQANLVVLEDGQPDAFAKVSDFLPGDLVDHAGPYVAEGLLRGMGVDASSLKPRSLPERHVYRPVAFALYRAAMAAEPDRAEVLSRIESAIQADPRFAMAYWYKGVLLAANGQEVEAEAADTRARRLDPDHERLSSKFDPVPAVAAAMGKAAWREIMPGLSTLRARQDDLKIEIAAWRVAPERFEFRLEIQESVLGQDAEWFRERAKGALAVNGGMFKIDAAKDWRNAYGLRVVDGKRLSDPWPETNGGFLVVAADRVHIIPTTELNKLEHGIPGVRHVLQSKPVLVETGGVFAMRGNDYRRHARTALCVEPNGAVIFLVVYEGGLSLYELASLLGNPGRKPASASGNGLPPLAGQPGALGCDAAIALDGGPSTQASMVGAPLISVKGAWKVYDAIVVVPRAVPPTAAATR